MTAAFHREYLVHLPLPLAQLYSRAYNAKDPRSQHDNAFYLFEALVKLMAAPLVAAYLAEVRHGGQRADSIDHLLLQLALPSLGQWVGIVRELARHFGTRASRSMAAPQSAPAQELAWYSAARTGDGHAPQDGVREDCQGECLRERGLGASTICTVRACWREITCSTPNLAANTMPRI